MTADEFDLWTADLGKKFPAVGFWIEKLPHAGELLADWRDALSHADLNDCLEVNRRFLAGDDDGPGKFPSDWQTLPASVRRLAESVRLRRESVSHRYSDEPSFATEPRYRCADCRDSGRMMVAHPAMVSAWFAGTLEQCKYRTASVLCGCPVSEPVRTLQKKEPNLRPIATYNSRIHYAIDWGEIHRWSFPLDAERLNKFAAWCEEQHAAWMASRRFGEFDQFNNDNAGAFV
jgi:hypothetical protein